MWLPCPYTVTVNNLKAIISGIYPFFLLEKKCICLLDLLKSNLLFVLTLYTQTVRSKELLKLCLKSWKHFCSSGNGEVGWLASGGVRIRRVLYQQC